MSRSRQVITMARTNASRFHAKYYNTTHYIAVVVTILLLLQIWWMARGHG